MSEGRPPLLELRGIHKRFPGVHALNGVDFTLHAGQVHALVGENGAGKSTLIKIIAGVYQRDSGTILSDGQEVQLLSPAESLARGIKVVYQELDLVRGLSVAENVFLGDYPRTRLGTIDWATMHAETARVLAEVGLDVNPTARVGTLSVAQQQLVEIARALAHARRVLIMDEPTSALSPAEVDRLFAVIASLKARGLGIIYVSHKLEEIFRIADHVTVLRDGRRVMSQPIAQSSPGDLIRAMVGRELHDLFPKSERTPGRVVLDVRGLSTATKLRDISLQVRAGEVVGVFGLLGAGLDELGKAIVGFEEITAGEVFVDGARVRPNDPADACAKGVGLLTENRKEDGLVLPLSVTHNMTLAALPSFARGAWLRLSSERQAAQSYVDRLGVKTPSLGQKVMFLSGGNQQKVLMARWMMRRPKALLLGEPTRGIDVGAKSEIHRLIDQMANEGLAVLVMSSEIPEILGISDRVLVMRDGRITAGLSRQEATQELLMANAIGSAA